MSTVVTMLRNPAKSLGCSLMEGQTGPVDQGLANELVRLKIAIVIEQPKPTEQLKPKLIQAVPEAPSIVAAAVEVPEPVTEQPVPSKQTRQKP